MELDYLFDNFLRNVKDLRDLEILDFINNNFINDFVYRIPRESEKEISFNEFLENILKELIKEKFNQDSKNNSDKKFENNRVDCTDDSVYNPKFNVKCDNANYIKNDNNFDLFNPTLNTKNLSNDQTSVSSYFSDLKAEQDKLKKEQELLKEKVNKSKKEQSQLFDVISNSIVKDKTNERYFIKNKISSNNDLDDSETKIRFRETKRNGDIIPGILDEDLLVILLRRNLNNPEKYKEILNLLKLYN